MTRIDEVTARRESYLAELDALSTDPEVTKARRLRAEGNAITMGNLRGGRPSDNLYDAVQILKHMIERGREAEETSDERTSREFREFEQEKRAALQAAQGEAYRRSLQG